MSLSPKLRFEVFKKYDFTCQYCGRRTPEIILEVDHIIPVSKGGTDEIENLISSCFDCNRGKGNSLLDVVLKDKDIHTETLMLAEREMQLQEYNHIKEQIRDREDAEIKILRKHFCRQFDYPQYAESDFEIVSSTIRQSLKFMSYIDIADLIDYAIRRTINSNSNDYHNTAASKYLGGILRNKIKEFNSR